MSSDVPITPIGAAGVQPSRWMRIRYRLKTGWREPTSAIGVLLTILFAYLIVVPIITLLYDAVEIQFGDARRAGGQVGGWTLYYVHRAMFSAVSRDLFWEPLINTLSVASAQSYFPWSSAASLPGSSAGPISWARAGSRRP